MTGPKAASSIHEKHLVSLGKALQALREEESVDALIEIAINYLQSELNFALIWVGLYDRTTHRIVGKGGMSPAGNAAALTQTYSLEPGDILEQVVVQQRPVGVADLQEEMRAGRWRKLAQKFEIHGTIIFPLRYRDHCLGVVMLGSQLWGVSPQSDEKSRMSMIFGELAATLYRCDADRQRQQVKKPEVPLMSLLGRLRTMASIDERLTAIAKEVHTFVRAHHTYIYWFEAENHHFWQRFAQTGQRVSTHANGRATPERNLNQNIPVQHVNSFYQALSADQIVVIGDVNSALNTDLSGRLMQYIQGTSLLAAPVLFQNELIGFIAVADNESRIWSDEEKTFMRSVTQLLSLFAPLENTEQVIQQVKLDQSLVGEVSRAIYSEDDWNQVFEICAERLCKRLKVQRFFVLTYNMNQEKFTVAYQNQPPRYRPLNRALQHLNDVDWQMLERSSDAVGVEDLEEDLKLMAWREDFLDLGMRSLLICNTSIGNPLQGMVVVGHDQARTWSRTERDLLRAVGQQIGLILRQWQLHSSVQHQEGFYQAIQWGLTAMQRTHNLEQLEQSSMQHIAGLLEAPLATLVAWKPGRKKAKVVAAAVTDNQFSIASDVSMSIHTDLLIQGTLATEGILSISVEHLSPETRHWLSGSGIGQLLTMVLRTAPEHEPSGILIVADGIDRLWSERHLDVLEILGSQLAWARRYLLLTENLIAHREELERLNWYKQRRLEEFCRNLNVNVRRLNDLSHQKDALASMRFHQITRQLGQMLVQVAPVIKREQWRIQSEHATMPLVTLLKRAMERVEALIKQRQIWSQVHNESNLNVGGDIPKIEFILFEVLSAACWRAEPNGRIDIWCRPLDFHWMELSITDNGLVEPILLEELHEGRSPDMLAPSALDTPPG
ncbi:MAG: GAF domain-containing protein, partial [Elainellaceae cyanobacterium]